MRIYISGKIGEDVPSSETLAKFVEAERVIVAHGHEAYNPTTDVCAHNFARMWAEVNGTSFYVKILLLDLLELTNCDAILLLPDWRTSPGARAEKALARALKKKHCKVEDGRLCWL